MCIWWVRPQARHSQIAWARTHPDRAMSVVDLDGLQAGAATLATIEEGFATGACSVRQC